MHRTASGALRACALGVLLVAVACLGCKDLLRPDGTGPDKIKISVSSGIRPTVSWHGGPVNFLAVVRAGALDGYYDQEPCAVWAIHTPDCDSIYSPAAYGQLPEGAQDVTHAFYAQTELTLGVEYAVKASRHGDYAMGVKTFRP